MKISAALLSALAAALLLQGCFVCDGLRQQAHDLRDEFAACAQGDTCVLVEGVASNDCTGTFVCASAINSERDEAEYRSRAQEVADSYGQSCNECAMPGCINPEDLTPVCNSETGLCELQPS